MAIPPVVQHRLDRLADGPIPSGALSIGEAAALEQVGFHQVDQVIGATAFAVPARSFFAYGTGALFTPSYPPGWQGGADGADPVVLTSSTARDGRVPTLITALKAGYRDAVKRLENEVRAIGADGAVGVRVSRRQLQDDGDQHPVWGFLATGTAVRSVGRTRASQPFTSALHGGEVAAALRGGWLPLRFLACPVMAVRWIGPEDQGRRRRTANRELRAHTAAVNACRHQARTDLAAAARAAGADGAIMSGMTLDFDAEWQTAQATVLVTGTALLHVRRGPEPEVQAAMSMEDSR